jgi:nicotinate-nucleotide--dimethylbenzimidazole phosphoribosyltransferase
VKRLKVTAPAAIDQAPPVELGRLGPALLWLASVQGAWPPTAPKAVRSVVATKGSTRKEGQAQADALADGGCDLLVLGADGDPVPGLVALSALLDLEPVAAIGTVAGPDWARLTTGVRDGLRTARMHVGDPDGMLKTIGSPVLAELTGLLAQSAARRTPIVLDGSALTAAAAMLAERIAPGAPAWWLAGQVPPLPAARKGLADIGMHGLLDLDLGGPEGADLAWTVLRKGLRAAPRRRRGQPRRG